MKYIHVTNIKWDTTDENGKRQKVWLPKSTFIPVANLTADVESGEIVDEIGDLLSDHFGFCHNGFEYEPVERAA